MQIKYKHSVHLIFSFILIAGVSGPANAVLLEKGFTAVYEVEHNGMYLGESERELKPLKDNHWQFHSITRPKGFAKMFIKDTLEETSILKRQGNDFIPIMYRYDQTGGKKPKHDSVKFDWENKQVSLSYVNKSLDLHAGTQDLMSFLLLIMRDLQNGHKQIQFTLADRKRINDYVLNVKVENQVDTPMRSFKSLVLVSNIIKDGDRFRIWCAPALQYLPVKIEKTEDDGDTTTMVIKSLSINK